jgi:hypothetical protein
MPTVINFALGMQAVGGEDGRVLTHHVPLRGKGDPSSLSVCCLSYILGGIPYPPNPL